jgi:prepilin-type N-terminal cleavage/methylation domain-containing protein
MRVVVSGQWSVVSGENRRVDRDARRFLRPLTPARPRRAFTLVELLITISIVALMASMVLFAAYAAQESAREHRTRVLITKLDQIVRDKWESYRTRRIIFTLTDEFTDCNGNGTLDAVGDFVDTNNNGTLDPGELTGMGPYVDANMDGMPNAGSEYTDYNSNGSPDPGEALDMNNNGKPDSPAEYNDINGNGVPEAYPPRFKARYRMMSLRNIMRMEMPERWSDIATVEKGNPPRVRTFPSPNWGPAIAKFAGAPTSIPPSSLWQGYFRKVDAANRASNYEKPTVEQQGAECLYMMVMAAIAEEGDARDVFKASDIKDVDGDGFPEFVDGWGRPISWLRWAPGFRSELNTLAQGTGSAFPSPDDPTGQFIWEFRALYANNPGLSPVNGTYVGGVLAGVQPSGELKADQVATITGYTFDPTLSPPGTCIFRCSTEKNKIQKPQMPSDFFVVLAPDPFDPARTYPVYTTTVDPTRPDLSTPTFALYPLIYSAGPDGYYGIATDLGYPDVISYSRVGTGSDPDPPGLNPFYHVAKGATVVGETKQFGTEPNKAWIDNIHSHLMGTR